MSDEATSAPPPGNRLAAVVPTLKAWVGSLAVSRKDLTGDAVAGVPGAVGSVPDGMAASVLAGVNPVHGLYASFAGPIFGGLTSNTRLMVITTTSAAALAAGSALQSFSAAEREQAFANSHFPPTGRVKIIEQNHQGLSVNNANASKLAEHKRTSVCAF